LNFLSTRFVVEPTGELYGVISVEDIARAMLAEEKAYQTSIYESS
jgi:CBS domain-containing protein